MDKILKGKFQVFNVSVTKGDFAEGKTGGQFLGNNRKIKRLDIDSLFEWLNTSEQSAGYQFFTYS